MLKLVFGLFGAAMVVAFLSAFILKVKEPAMTTVAVIGVVMMLIDLWQARNEKDV
jgi:xanthosine utilization system XapX-like protein